MKMVQAIIRAERMDNVKKALEEKGRCRSAGGMALRRDHESWGSAAATRRVAKAEMTASPAIEIVPAIDN